MQVAVSRHVSKIFSLNSLRFLSNKIKMSKSLVILPEGCEEMELVGSIDILRRCGITTIVAGLDGVDAVKCSRDVKIVPDVMLSSVDKDSFDCIVLPGGLGGANNMSQSALVGELLKHQESSGKLIAAICASPALVLKAHGIGVGKKITCYPAFKDKLDGKYEFVDEVVVQDGKLITSQGPSTVFAFALKIAENLVGAEKANEVSKAILLK